MRRRALASSIRRGKPSRTIFLTSELAAIDEIESAINFEISLDLLAMVTDSSSIILNASPCFRRNSALRYKAPQDKCSHRSRSVRNDATRLLPLPCGPKITTSDTLIDLLQEIGRAHV